MRRYKKKDYTKLNQILISSFLIFLMVASVLGFVLNYNTDTGNPLSYNGYNFEVSSDNSYIFTEIDGVTYQFYNVPVNLEILGIPPQAIIDIKQADLVYFTFDPNYDLNLPYAELIRFDLDNYMLSLNKFSASGIFEPNVGAYSQFPFIDCNNATVQTPVIKLINDNITKFEYDNNCLQIHGTGTELVRSRDRLMYGLLGVMNG